MDKRRLLALSGAIGLFLSAIWILWRAGLPDSPDFVPSMEGERLEVPQVGGVAPTFASTTLEGQEIALLDARGTPVILNFWATWCRPCAVEMPILEAIYQAGVNVVGINVGLERQETVQGWVENANLTFPIVVDDAGRTLEAKYRIQQGLPVTFFIDRQGIIQYIQYGALDENSLQAGLESIGITN